MMGNGEAVNASDFDSDMRRFKSCLPSQLHLAANVLFLRETRVLFLRESHTSNSLISKMNGIDFCGRIETRCLTMQSIGMWRSSASARALGA